MHARVMAHATPRWQRLQCMRNAQCRHCHAQRLPSLCTARHLLGLQTHCTRHKPSRCAFRMRPCCSLCGSKMRSRLSVLSRWRAAAGMTPAECATLGSNDIGSVITAIQHGRAFGSVATPCARRAVAAGFAMLALAGGSLRLLRWLAALFTPRMLSSHATAKGAV